MLGCFGVVFVVKYVCYQCFDRRAGGSLVNEYFTASAGLLAMQHFSAPATHLEFASLRVS